MSQDSLNREWADSDLPPQEYRIKEAFTVKIVPYTLRFKTPVGTSRGIYSCHQVWYIIITSIDNPSHCGVGECAPLPDLSCDALSENEYAERLQTFCRDFEQTGSLKKEMMNSYPSMLFGFETAIRHYNKRSLALWDTPFSRGIEHISINGLIWMGQYPEMLKQIEQKLEQGFRCIKLKIGAIDFEEEINLLKGIRRHFSSDQITLRVDANGAFTPNEALEKLKRLSELDLHSIEQPIGAKQWSDMALLCKDTPLAIALDEELIGCNIFDQKKLLLETIKPQYIILKPSLHGGISGCNEWIEIATQNKIGWWITSALESNIGLNAIAQWCATLNNPLPQGLGTGALYTNNIKMPLITEGDRLKFDPTIKYDNLSIGQK